jgi:hypothetical protein
LRFRCSWKPGRVVPPLHVLDSQQQALRIIVPLDGDAEHLLTVLYGTVSGVIDCYCDAGWLRGGLSVAAPTLSGGHNGLSNPGYTQ